MSYLHTLYCCTLESNVVTTVIKFRNWVTDTITLTFSIASPEVTRHSQLMRHFCITRTILITSFYFLSLNKIIFNTSTWTWETVGQFIFLSFEIRILLGNYETEKQMSTSHKYQHYVKYENEGKNWKLFQCSIRSSSPRPVLASFWCVDNL